MLIRTLTLISLSFLLVAFGSKKSNQTSLTPRHVKYYNEGIAAQKKGDYNKAIELYERALSYNPNFAEAWNNLGYSYRYGAKKYLKKAGVAYAKAIKLKPDFPEALEYQGEYFIMCGELVNAYENYKKLLKLDPPEADLLKSKLDPVLNDARKVLQSYRPEKTFHHSLMD